MKKGNVLRLLDNSLESFYWLGFILADGNFHNKVRLKLDLGETDQDQVKKFCEYLGKEYTSRYSGSFMDCENVPKIFEKLGLNEDTPKTYAPPSQLKYECMEDDQFIALFIGFIDGDGCIQYQTERATSKISLKMYNTWVDILDWMVNRIYKINGLSYESKAIIDNRGYAKVSFANYKVVKFLKSFVMKNNLPALSRKWDKIDENLDTKDEKLAKIYLKIKVLLSYKIDHNTIADILEIENHIVKRCSAGGK